MPHLRLLIVAIAVLLLASPGALTVSAQDSPRCPPRETPRFVFGFNTLKDNLGEIMGEPVTCEFADLRGTGDTLQQTTTLLAFWRKSTNTPTFTDGWHRWALTTAGLVYWTGDEIDPPAQAMPVRPPALPPPEPARAILALYYPWYDPD